MKKQTSAVLASIHDPSRQRSQLTLVLRVLLLNGEIGEWRSLAEIGTAAGIPASSAGSRIRDLRLQGFNIKRSKLYTKGNGPLVWVYKIFHPQA